MITLQGIDQLINWYANTRAIYWRAYDSDTSSKRLVGSNIDKEESSQDDAIRSIRAFVSLYSQNGLRVYFWAIDSKGNKNGGYYTWVEIPALQASAPVAGIGAIPSGYVKEDEIQSKVKEALDSFKTELRIKELEAQIKDMQTNGTGLEGPLDRIAGTLEPYMPMIIKGVFGIENKPSAVGTAPESNSQQSASSVEDQMRRDLETLADKVTNLPDLLTKLAAKSKEDLETAIQFL